MTLNIPHLKASEGLFIRQSILAKKTGKPKSMKYLLQRLSVAVPHGNCVAVLGSTGHWLAVLLVLDLCGYYYYIIATSCLKNIKKNFKNSRSDFYHQWRTH